MIRQLDKMDHLVSGKNIILLGDVHLNQDNSTTISGGINTGNQFANASENFAGKINNVNRQEKEEFNKITESLKNALKLESSSFEQNEIEEITGVINEVQETVVQEKINKLSLRGKLSMITEVMSGATKISTSTHKIYEQWNGLISDLISKL